MPGSLLSMSNSEIERVVLRNEQLKQRFPFLNAASQAKQNLDGCSACQKKGKSAKYMQALEQVRSHVSKMNNADKAEFKRILGVDQVRFYYTAWEDGIQKRKAVRF